MVTNLPAAAGSAGAANCGVWSKHPLGCCLSSSNGTTEWRAMIASRSEEHTSELQSLMRTSYDVFCLKKKKKTMDSNKLERKYTALHTQTYPPQTYYVTD